MLPRGHSIAGVTNTTQRYVMACCTSIKKLWVDVHATLVYNMHVRDLMYSLHMYSMHGDPTVVYSPFLLCDLSIEYSGVISLSDVLKNTYST